MDHIFDLVLVGLAAFGLGWCLQGILYETAASRRRRADPR